MPHKFHLYLIFSYCKENLERLPPDAQLKANEKLPLGFQSQLLCAGDTVGREGSCQGDSGGPMMIKVGSNSWVQIATVFGALGTCGDPNFPGLFVRIDDPKIFEFIQSTLTTSTLSTYKEGNLSYLKIFSNTLGHF